MIFLVIDSSGKPMPGILRGHATFVGLISQCENIKYEYTDTSRKFRGQYIRVAMNQNFKNYSEDCKSAFFSWDLCFPYSCTKKDLLTFFRACKFIINSLSMLLLSNQWSAGIFSCLLSESF